MGAQAVCLEIGRDKRAMKSKPNLKKSRDDGTGLIGGLPGIDCRVGVALSAKSHRIGVAASAVPDIEDSTFRA